MELAPIKRGGWHQVVCLSERKGTCGPGEERRDVAGRERVGGGEDGGEGASWRGPGPRTALCPQKLPPVRGLSPGEGVPEASGAEEARRAAPPRGSWWAVLGAHWAPLRDGDWALPPCEQSLERPGQERPACRIPRKEQARQARPGGPRPAVRAGLHSRPGWALRCSLKGAKARQEGAVGLFPQV